MIGPTDISVIFGQRGSGKSTLGRSISNLYRRVLVIDRLREWTEGDLITDNLIEIENFLINSLGKSNFKIIFQFNIEAESEAQSVIFNSLLRSIYYRGKISGENVCILIEEVHFFASTHKVEKWLQECIFTGRHANLAIIASSQRPASVNKALISQAANIFIGQLYEKRDIDYLFDCIGEIAENIPKLNKFEFLHYSIGKPATVLKNNFLNS